MRAVEVGRDAPVGIQPLVVHQVDVFTDTPLTGNAAAVVLQADKLSDSAMLAIAREMNLSETAFVFADRSPGVVPVRFFTPRTEIPVCGHATLAAQYVRAKSLGQAEGRVIQASPGARWEVHWRQRDGGWFMVMTQGPVRFGMDWDDHRVRELCQALQIDRAMLAPGLAVHEVSTGHPKVVVPIATQAALAAITPDLGALASLSDITGVAGYFLFAMAHGDDALTVCRMFAPGIGISEDPVNGSGHGPLAAYLLSQGGSLAAAARDGFWSRMGAHLGRPGRVWVRAARDGRSVDVGGDVVDVFAAEVAMGPATRVIQGHDGAA